MKKKNLLAENMLRFKAKNLSETTKRKIVKLAEIITERTGVEFKFSDNPNGTMKAKEDYQNYFNYLGGNTGNLDDLIGKTAYIFNTPATNNNPANMTSTNLYTEFEIKLVSRSDRDIILIGSATKETIDPKTNERKIVIDRSKPFITISNSTVPHIRYHKDYSEKQNKYNEPLQNFVLMKAFGVERSKTWN